METNQVKLLSSLAKKIKAEKKDKSTVIVSLQNAKILTKEGNLTGNYNNLKRIVSTVK
ncbi:hypothetical protein [Sphingobacterium pedocola]|uniref:hypothetical protein n=1 Tax=Sphingobacterium pedocola TaxID=2082722 RepID=UPI0018CA26E1|nr:hypothetical protein [Sphingobacterium pedocola]